MYLKIGGFYYKLIFHNIGSKKVTPVNNLRLNITKYLKGFVINSIPDKTDYHIDFYRTQIISTNKTVNSNRYKLLHFFKEEDNKITTFQHISISHFYYIITYTLAKLLTAANGLVLHASAIHLKDEVAIFTGPSGAGKTTAASLLSKHCQRLANDSVIIRKENDKYLFYQTPYFEKVQGNEIVKTHRKFKLGKIFFLKKTTSCKIEKITSKKDVFQYLMSQIIMEDKVHMKKKLNILTDFIRNHNNFYYLYFPVDEDAVSKVIQQKNCN